MIVGDYELKEAQSGRLVNFHVRGINVIEVVMVLVVVAILASTAVPSFISDRTDTQQAAVDGIAGSLGSASAINYAVRSISPSHGVHVSNCADIAKALEEKLSSDYTIQPANIDPGTKTKCTVTSESGFSAEFVGHGIS
ncbi:MAG: type II secretion system protein [Gammaproteobacteria bacterium]|jgi:MSHA pilin protein MshA